jgi:hypothetical protein
MRGTTKILAVLALAVLVAAYVLRPAPQSVTYVSPVSIETQTEIVAGETLELVVDMPAAAAVKILALSGASTLLFTPELPDGRSSWTVPDAVTKTAGRLTLMVGDHQMEVAIAASDPNSFTNILLGPRTIVADGNDLTLAVVAPGDVYGNALPDRTPVEFQRLGPNNDRSSNDRDVERSLAWTRLGAGTTAGTNSVWVRVGTTTGVPAVLNEVPGVATSVELELETTVVVADGRQVIELATAELVDEFGNQLPDGVAGVFQLTTANTTTVVPATVQRGRLRAFWTAPDTPATLDITASVNGQTSAGARIRAAIGARPFEVAGALEVDGYRIRVGPILDPSGALVANGTEVLIGDRSTTTADGVATALVQSDLGRVSVTVLGRTVEHRIQP